MLKEPERQSTFDYKDAKANVKINRQAHTLTPGAVIINNSIYLPLKPVITALGGKIAYNTATGKTQITLGNKSVAIAAESYSARDNTTNQPISLQTAPQTINGSLYLSASEARRLLGLKAAWDTATRTLSLEA